MSNINNMFCFNIWFFCSKARRSRTESFWYNENIKERKAMGEDVINMLKEWKRTKSITLASKICETLLKEAL